mmetsp:Transcript_38117/g.92253  ORF Transcript_38117/g.92253 Transcript_38117/m.92253 type:complete len:407 (+) Transcript_38117:26-1246(+)
MMRANLRGKDEEKLYRSWNHSYNTKSDPEILRLENESHKTLVALHEIRRRGQQIRSNRSQELDALEMRRMTLVEILKRMENDLRDKDSVKYGKVLAKVFGERKVKVQKAKGMESRLCQLMHQMLAKQHQLKIMKNSAKAIQQLYKDHKLRNKDEFHSYDALSVKLEAARLSLLAMYDDVFAQQHRVLAMLQDRKTEGTVSNYTLPKSRSIPPIQVLQVSTKHQYSVEDLASPSSFNSMGSNEDYKSAMDVLDDVSLGSGTRLSTDEVKTSIRISNGNESTRHTPPEDDSMIKDPNSKSARERRREIEHLRQARVLGNSSPQWNSRPVTSLEETAGASSHRQRMRELEAVRKKLKPKTSEPVNINDDNDELRPRGEGSAKSRSPRTVLQEKSIPQYNDDSNAATSEQ